MKKSILIVGGSIAGLSAALLFASAKKDELDFDITVIDDSKPDINAVAVYNVPLFPKAINGQEILEKTRKQISDFLKVNYVNDTVVEIGGEKGAFTTKTKEKEFKSDYIILATGASKFDIQGLGDIVTEHKLMNKPNKICLKHSKRQLVKDGIYVAGTAAGITSMIACAMGSGTEAACAILSDIKGAITIVHDTPSSRK